MLYKNAHIVKYEQISDKLNILIENSCDEIYYEDFLVQVLVLKKNQKHFFYPAPIKDMDNSKHFKKEVI